MTNLGFVSLWARFALAARREWMQTEVPTENLKQISGRQNIAHKKADKI